MKSFVLLLKFHLRLFLGTTDNKKALIQEMAWRWTGNMPLSEPMLTQFIDTNTRGRWVKSHIDENNRALHPELNISLNLMITLE